MKRNSILVLGLGALLGFGLFAPGCGDSGDGKNNKGDGAVDGKKDSAGIEAGKGTGGKIGAGGSTGTGGMIGAGGAIGNGGAIGSGGTPGLDAGIDVVVPPDTNKPKDLGSDAIDAPQNPEEVGNPMEVGKDTKDVKPIDVTPVNIDGSLDSTGDTTVSLDTAIDQAADTADGPTLDTGSLDAELDGGLD
jgi:hypothetical protein